MPLEDSDALEFKEPVEDVVEKYEKRIAVLERINKHNEDVLAIVTATMDRDKLPHTFAAFREGEQWIRWFEKRHQSAFSEMCDCLDLGPAPTSFHMPAWYAHMRKVGTIWEFFRLKDEERNGGRPLLLTCKTCKSPYCEPICPSRPIDEIRGSLKVSAYIHRSE
jgi:hypothetical protein